MQDTDALLDSLIRSAEPEAAAAVVRLIRDGSDAELAAVNPLAFAAEHRLAEAAVISALLHAARLGLFEMTWNVICPSCGGILDANATLKGVRQDAYHCAFCTLDTEPTLDDTVEVSFRVSSRVRRIGAHDPDGLTFWDYHRQVFFGSAVNFPDAFSELADRALVESAELEAGERIILALRLSEPAIVLDPVTHATHTIELVGERTDERQDLTLVFSDSRGCATGGALRPGPVRLTLDNRTAARVLPGVFSAGEALQALIGGRRPFLSAKRLLSSQTFRDLYRTDTLEIDQRLKIVSLTFLFTDLKGSTALYERVGDLVAYDLVRAHFRILNEIVAGQSGAVVKTIGDAVMATFPTPDRALAAALAMHEAMNRFNAERGVNELILKIGIHEGPCLAVSSNDRQDYFGQTVNIAARVQELAGAQAVFATESVVRHVGSSCLLSARRVRSEQRSLRGIGGGVTIYEIA
ncbi:adenylate/guanylate cyclase domain-containing protein [Methylobacterium planeticum]|uniref:Adenylate/guanylate cyclase domain-containing protein n=1 Tax=Methylobacterium planeticum TaxID=2615211 RepID=A0A6N6MP42_9HYPH|nr:adenylate/guanylate cyclase domain-containing protein [Methylobacterium planeticum]KAB1071684.1 adenylate/guanylate cyclase domain-containing protein [Methylobacterium planeticum]